MMDNLQFENLLRSFEQFSDGCEKIRADQESSETLIASAEYELEQLKRLFADARLDAAVVPKAPVALAEAPQAPTVVIDTAPIADEKRPTPLAA